MPGCTPKQWGLIPRADDCAGPVPSASRCSTIAPFVGTQKSCDRWQLAETCSGHSPLCPCSTYAQASSCLPRWTAPRCPSSWTNTESLPRWVQLGSASLVVGDKMASVSSCSRWWGLGEVGGRTHRPAYPTEAAAGGVLSSARAIPANAKH